MHLLLNNQENWVCLCKSPSGTSSHLDISPLLIVSSLHESTSPDGDSSGLMKVGLEQIKTEQVRMFDSGLKSGAT